MHSLFPTTILYLRDMSLTTTLTFMSARRHYHLFVVFRLVMSGHSVVLVLLFPQHSKDRFEWSPTEKVT
jgi:hypothetical protein